MAFESDRRLRWPAPYVLLAIIVLGVWFRFAGLGLKPVWYDEVASFLYLGGGTQAQLDRLYDGRALRVDELLGTFQGGTRSATAGTPTTSPATVADVVRAVAADEPQSGALYFALVKALVADTDNPAHVRALSAVASTLSLLLLGLLAWRLFDRDTALVAVALAALSPLEIRFAHEARPYALCAALLLASALAAVRARHARDARAWLLYALCLTAALWAHPIALVAVPGLLALAVTSTQDHAHLYRRQTWRAGLLATAAALIAWIPWALVCWSAYPKIQRLTAWSSEAIGLDGLARGWLGALTSLFFRPRGEGGLLPSDLPEAASTALSIALASLAVAIAVAALVSIARHRDRSARRYVILLVVLPWLAFATWDVVLGGRRSTVPRYLIPAWAALQMAVAYWLMRSGARRGLRDLLLVLLLTLGASTAWHTQAARGWWDTDVPRLLAVQEAAAAINAIPGAVVVTDAQPLSVLEFARHLHPQTSLRLGAGAATSLGDAEWSRAVLVAPSPTLLDAMSQRAASRGEALVRWQPRNSGPELWRATAK